MESPTPLRARHALRRRGSEWPRRRGSKDHRIAEIAPGDLRRLRGLSRGSAWSNSRRLNTAAAPRPVRVHGRRTEGDGRRSRRRRARAASVRCPHGLGNADRRWGLRRLHTWRRRGRGRLDRNRELRVSDSRGRLGNLDGRCRLRGRLRNRSGWRLGPRCMLDRRRRCRLRRGFGARSRLGRRGGRRRRHRRRAGRQERQRIDVAVRIARDAHAEVDIRNPVLRRPTRPNRADNGALADDVALADRRRTEVDERHRVTAGRLDRHDLAVRADGPCKRDDAGSRRKHILVALPARSTPLCCPPAYGLPP